MKIKLFLILSFILVVGVCFLAYENPSIQEDMHNFEDNLLDENGFNNVVENYSYLGGIALKLEHYIDKCFSIVSRCLDKISDLF